MLDHPASPAQSHSNNQVRPRFGVENAATERLLKLNASREPQQHDEGFPALTRTKSRKLDAAASAEGRNDLRLRVGPQQFMRKAARSVSPTAITHPGPGLKHATSHLNHSDLESNGPLMALVNEDGDVRDGPHRGSADRENEFINESASKMAPVANVPRLRADESDSIRAGSEPLPSINRSIGISMGPSVGTSMNSSTESSSGLGPGSSRTSVSSGTSASSADTERISPVHAANSAAHPPAQWVGRLLGPMEPMELSKAQPSKGYHSHSDSGSRNSFPAIHGFPVEDPGLASPTSLSRKYSADRHNSGFDYMGYNMKHKLEGRSQNIPSISEDSRLANAMAADFHEHHDRPSVERSPSDRSLSHEKIMDFPNAMADMYSQGMAPSPWANLEPAAYHQLPRHNQQHALPQHGYPQHGYPQHALPQHALPQHAPHHAPQHQPPQQHALPQHAPQHALQHQPPQHQPPQNRVPQHRAPQHQPPAYGSGDGLSDILHARHDMRNSPSPAQLPQRHPSADYPVGRPSISYAAPPDTTNALPSPTSALANDSAEHRQRLAHDAARTAVPGPAEQRRVLPLGILPSLERRPVDDYHAGSGNAGSAGNLMHPDVHVPLTTTAYPVLFRAPPPPVNTAPRSSSQLPPFTARSSSAPSNRKKASSTPRPQKPAAPATGNAPPPQTEDRIYRCTHPGCKWSFARSSDQKRHVRSHMKPSLRCPYCDLEDICNRKGGMFYRLDVLKRHLRLVHLNRPTDGSTEGGECRVCGRNFSKTRDFIDHCDACAKEALAKSPDKSEKAYES